MRVNYSVQAPARRGSSEKTVPTIKVTGPAKCGRRTKALAKRLKDNYPQIDVRSGSNDPADHDLVVNATPMGMNEGDPLPMDISRIAPDAFVGEVVMKTEMTPLLQAAQERGCRFQIGTDMLYEMIPAYLEFFGYGSTTAEELRRLSKIEY